MGPTSSRARRGALNIGLAAAGLLCGLVGAGVGTASAATAPCGATGVYTASGTTATCTYSNAGAEDTFTAPSDVTSLSVTAVGGAGGIAVGDYVSAGEGAIVTNTALPVTASGELWVDVGANGGTGSYYGNPAGGQFDGASGGTAAGSGGGSSALLTSPRASATLTADPATDSRLLVAGAGGGASIYGGGGSAGDTTVAGAGDGGGESYAPGGNGGVGAGGGTAGSCFGYTGGNGSPSSAGGGTDYAAGGGGGWVGGGGGCENAGGGGGSSYAGAGPASGITIAETPQAPEVVISYQLATPTLSTTVNDAATSAAWSGKETTGASADDTASLGALAAGTPTGTVTYSLYAGTACTGTAASTQTVALTASGSVPAATATGPLGGGGDSYQASYSGDGTYAGVTAACEPFTVALAMVTISNPVTVSGSSASDSATLTGTVSGFTPTGTVTYTLYAGSGCAGTAKSTQTVMLSGGMVPTSSSSGTLAVGSYSYQAAYSGDANDTPASHCTAFTVSKLADLSVTVSGPKSAADGTSFSEVVTVTNAGPAAAGSVVSGLGVPAGVTVSSTGGGKQVGSAITWTASSIAAGAKVTYTATFKVNQKTNASAVFAAATASTANPDPNLANNAAVNAVTLGSGPSGHAVRAARPSSAGRRLERRLRALVRR